MPVRTGDWVGRFELGSVLGHGGMATVFRSRDPQLNRDVAVKVLSPALSIRPDGAERFRREALAVAAIRHRGIVEIHDFVPANDQHAAFLVEELIDGPTLQDLIEGQKSPFLPEVAALLVAEVAEALQATHDRGIVHRDIKPANIMLERRGETARVVLTDFGVAHMGDLTTMTATGAVVGSPAYMAPEQGRGQDIGPACDVWALGVVLYQLCTRHLPFSGRDPITTMLAVNQGRFHRAAQICACVGPDIDAIICGCLKADPAQRVPSAGELARRLRQAAADAGLPDGASVLRGLLDDPDGLHSQYRPQLAKHAIERARTHIKARQLARALAELGRATGHVPGHPEAERLLQSISTRRRQGKVTRWVAGVLAITGATLWFFPERSVQVPQMSSPQTAAAVDFAPADVPGTVVLPVSTALTPPEDPLVHPGRKKTRQAGPNLQAASPALIQTATTATVPALDLSPDAPVMAPPMDVQRPKPPQGAPPARVRLLAQRAFCYPALDDDPGSTTPALYPNVPPGLHQVYCAQDRGGPREYVGALDVKPGAQIERSIIPGPDGKPVFSGSR